MAETWQFQPTGGRSWTCSHDVKMCQKRDFTSPLGFYLGTVSLSFYQNLEAVHKDYRPWCTTLDLRGSATTLLIEGDSNPFESLFPNLKCVIGLHECKRFRSKVPANSGIRFVPAAEGDAEVARIKAKAKAKAEAKAEAIKKCKDIETEVEDILTAETEDGKRARVTLTDLKDLLRLRIEFYELVEKIDDVDITESDDETCWTRMKLFSKDIDELQCEMAPGPKEKSVLPARKKPRLGEGNSTSVTANEMDLSHRA